MPESIFDRRAAAGLVIDRADDLACVYHIVHVSADRDAGEVDLLGDLLAGKEAIPGSWRGLSRSIPLRVTALRLPSGHSRKRDGRYRAGRVPRGCAPDTSLSR